MLVFGSVRKFFVVSELCRVTSGHTTWNVILNNVNVVLCYTDNKGYNVKIMLRVMCAVQFCVNNGRHVYYTDNKGSHLQCAAIHGWRMDGGQI